MIYIDKTSDMSVFEINTKENNCPDHGGSFVQVSYSDIGDWTEYTKNTRALSVTDLNHDLVHYVIREDGTTISLDVCEMIHLYFALDFYYKHSGLCTGINEVKMLKFEKVDD